MAQGRQDRNVPFTSGIRSRSTRLRCLQRHLEAVPPGPQTGPGGDGRRRAPPEFQRHRDRRRPGCLPPVRPGPARFVQRPPPPGTGWTGRAHLPSLAHPACWAARRTARHGRGREGHRRHKSVRPSVDVLRQAPRRPGRCGQHAQPPQGPANAADQPGASPGRYWPGSRPTSLTCSGSPLTSPFHSTTTKPNATYGWSSSNNRSPAAGDPTPAPEPSSPSGLTLEPSANTARAQWPCPATCSPANDGSAVGASPSPVRCGWDLNGSRRPQIGATLVAIAVSPGPSLPVRGRLLVCGKPR